VTEPLSADVWLAPLPVRQVDGIGRAIGWSGATLIAAAAATAVCPASAGQPCTPRALPDGRSRCPACGAWWSVSHVAGGAGIARSRLPVGIDVEDRRHRPAAFRAASAWCAVELTAAEQWTQAEALWKAAGLGRRRPAAGEIPLPEAWTPGWQASRDGQWWLYTASLPFPWSVALPRTGGARPRLRRHTLTSLPKSNPIDPFVGAARRVTVLDRRKVSG
jgi:hypothetical protein